MDNLEPITRNEMFLNGDDLEPITREEMILAGADLEPITRHEWFLKKYRGGGGGGGYDLVNVPNLPADIASFTDGTDLPMASLKVAVTPYQDLHGYDAPWAGGAGKNKLNANNKTISEGDYVVNNVPIVLSAGTYTFSFDYSGSGVGSASSFRIDDSNGTAIFTANKTVANGNNSIEITLTSAGSFVKYYSNAVGSYSNLMIEAGSSVTTFAPYSNICPIIGWDEAVVTRCGKNLFDKSNQEDGWYTSGSAVGHVAEIIAGSTSYACHKDIFIKGGYTYKLSFHMTTSDTLRPAYVLCDRNMIILSYEYWSAQVTDYTFTISPTQDGWLSACTADKEKWGECDIQLEIGDTATTYSPYNGATYTIDLNGTRYGGVVDAVSGVMEITNGYIEYDGSSDEDWQKHPTLESWFFMDRSIPNAYLNNSKTDYAISNMYKQKEYSSVTDLVNGEFALGEIRNRLVFKNTNYADLVSFKNGLVSNPIQLCYKLATPITVQLSPTQVKSLEGTNNIFADCGQITEVKYFKKA